MSDRQGHLEYLRGWSYDPHDRSSVRDGVGQHVPHRVVCFTDRCLFGTHCFLLSVAQRHTFFVLQIWSERFANRWVYRKIRKWLTLTWILVDCAWVYHDHTSHGTMHSSRESTRWIPEPVVTDEELRPFGAAQTFPHLSNRRGNVLCFLTSHVTIL